MGDWNDDKFLDEKEFTELYHKAQEEDRKGRDGRDGTREAPMQGPAMPCACKNLPNTGACGDACRRPSQNAEAECMKSGFASCADYCFMGDMGGKCD